MEIVNRTRNTVLADKVVIADTLFGRIKGLLGSKDFRWGEALIIKRCNSIHTFFMCFPIDVLFINSKNKIIFMKQALLPWRVSRICWQAKYVIELPCGTITHSKTSLGDEISLV